MKKILTGILAGAITITLLSGCAGNESNGTSPKVTKADLDPEKIGYYSTLKLPLDKNYTKLSILCDTSVTTNNDSVVIKELEKRTGLDIDIVAIPRATIAEKAAVLLASKDDMPDIFNRSVANLDEYGMQGAFEPIDDHIDELPNLKEIFYTKAEEHRTVDVIKGFKAGNGKLYCFPIYDISRAVNSSTMYRKDIFDKHGLKADWNGPEEFYQVLKKLKELYPNSTPFSVKLGSKLFTRLGDSWGLAAKDFTPYFDEQTRTWKHMATDPKFKEILDFVKKLYDEKLIDQEFLTITENQWAQNMVQKDKVFVTNDWIGRMEMYKEQTKDTIPEYDLRAAGPIGPSGKYGTLNFIQKGPAIVKNEKSLLALKLCDYLISPSGAQLISMGVEGVTYNLDEKGFAQPIGYAEGETPGIDELESKYGLYISGLYMRFDKRSTYFKYSEREQEAQDIALNKEDGFEPLDPVLMFTSDEKGKKSDIETTLKKKAEEFAVKYVLTKNTGDSAWNEWLKEAKKWGEDDLLKIYNDAQKRFDALD